MNSMYVDVAAVFEGGATAPEPNILPFVNDSYLFYAGEFNLVFGDAETGKTWLCLTAVAATIAAGGRAVVIDLDHNGAPSILSRLEALGVSRNHLIDRQCFRMATPGSDIELKELISDLAVFRPDVVVLDSLGEVMPLFGGNSNSADDFTMVHAGVIKPLALAGAAVLAVDHLSKGTESRAFGPTGTVAKTRAVGGTAVRVSAEKAFRPGEGGKAKLELHKDRHGGVRKQVPSSDNRPVIGTFTLIEDDGRLAYSFQAALTVPIPRQGDIDAARTKADVARLIELHESGIQVDNIRAVKEALVVGQSRAKAALDAFRAEQAGLAETAA